MKKILFIIFAIGMAFVSCEKSEIALETMKREDVQKTVFEKRSFSDALQIAQEAAEMLETGINTRAEREIRRVVTDNVKIITSKGITRGTEDADTILYVFNYEDNAGFAVVSANKRTEGLIAVTEQGVYDESTEEENIGLGIYMDLARMYACMSDSSLTSDNNDSIPMRLDPMYELIYEEEYVNAGQYGPLFFARWHQQDPFNRFCKSSNGASVAAGCAAISIMQVLSYYEYPSSIQLTYQGNYPSSSITLDWDSINLVRIHNDPLHFINCANSNNIHNQLGYLTRQVGEYCGINYLGNNSGATEYGLRSALTQMDFHYVTYYNYSNSHASEMRTALRNGHPAIIAGETANYSDSHMWNVDGYKAINVYVLEYRRMQGSPVMELLSREYNRTLYYNHFNWGLYGLFNGYFLNNVFDMNSYQSLDSGCYAAPNGINYSRFSSFCIDIYPND